MMTAAVDVVVTDGFTGNVVLKTLEGGLTAVIDWLESLADGNEARPDAGARAGGSDRSIPRPPAAPSCWGCEASRSSATARRRRGRSPTPSRPPRTCSRADVVRRSPPRSASPGAPGARRRALLPGRRFGPSAAAPSVDIPGRTSRK